MRFYLDLILIEYPFIILCVPENNVVLAMNRVLFSQFISPNTV